MLGKTLNRVRHGRVGRRLHAPWKLLRPAWRTTASVVTRGRGFRHVVNGVDEFRLSLDLSHNLNPYDWEPEEYLEVMATVSKGDHFIDIGAFWGLFSLGAAKRVGASGRVVAIEPGPRQGSMLRTNVRANDYGEIIQCLEKVCSDTVGELIEFFIDPEGAMVDSAVATPGRNSVSVKRPTITVDSLVSELRLQPTVIKIDVEGFEDLVLNGATETLQRHKPTLFIEFHPEQLSLRGVETDDILVRLEQFGFKCEELSDRSTMRAGHLFKFNHMPAPGLINE